MRQPVEARSNAEAPMAQRMGDFAPSLQLSTGTGAEGALVATFLYARMHHFGAVCQALSAEDAAAFVHRKFAGC